MSRMGNLTRTVIAVLTLGCAGAPPPKPVEPKCPEPKPAGPPIERSGGIAPWMTDLLKQQEPERSEPTDDLPSDDEAARIRAAMDRRYPSCTEPRPRGALCGLMQPLFWSEESMQRFADACNQEGKDADQCADEVRDAWSAALQARYPRANPAAVRAMCAGRCTTPRQVELAWFVEHNAGVDRELRALGVEP